jgi:hypothetical protein
MRTSRVAAAVAVAWLSVSAAPAVASGGADIGSAPTAVFGVPEYGDTAADHRGDCASEQSWWTLPVVAGDRVTMAFGGDVAYEDTWPVGTTDATVASASPSRAWIGGDGRGWASLTAPATGTMPVEFTTGGCAAPAGPYDFIAYVKHVVRLSLHPGGRVAPRGHVNVGVRNSDGVAISDPELLVDLQARRPGRRWTTLGTATASHGRARIAYVAPRWMRDRTVYVRAAAYGDQYLPRATRGRSVTFRRR